MTFINTKRENSQDILELPLELDGTLLISTLKSHFANATGLKFKAETGNYRGIKLADNKLHPPAGGFGEEIFVIVEPDSGN